jgi:hypothetical protein
VALLRTAIVERAVYPEQCETAMRNSLPMPVERVRSRMCVRYPWYAGTVALTDPAPVGSTYQPRRSAFEDLQTSANHVGSQPWMSVGCRPDRLMQQSRSEHIAFSRAVAESSGVRRCRLRLRAPRRGQPRIPTQAPDGFAAAVLAPGGPVSAVGPRAARRRPPRCGCARRAWLGCSTRARSPSSR